MLSRYDAAQTEQLKKKVVASGLIAGRRQNWSALLTVHCLNVNVYFRYTCVCVCVCVATRGAHALATKHRRGLQQDWIGNYLARGPDAAKFGAQIAPLMEKYGDKKVRARGVRLCVCAFMPVVCSLFEHTLLEFD